MDTTTLIIAALIVLVLGAVLFGALKPLVVKVINAFKERAPLIKRYWKLVIPLVGLTAISYVAIYMFAYSEANIALVGQISGLILAIIAGYIAFTELGESRFDKLEDSGMEEFREMRLKSARLKLEEAHAIKPKDLTVLSNLLELYIIEGVYEKFDGKVSHYRRSIIEETDELTILYLLALKELVQDHPKDAKEKIKDIIQYVTLHSRARDTFGWNNKELKQSETYKSLSTDTKTLADNVLAYINKKLDEDKELRFADGDFILKDLPKEK
jgi:hypothetical protein